MARRVPQRVRDSHQAHYMLATEDSARHANPKGLHGAGYQHERAVTEERGAFNNDGAAWAGGLRMESANTEHLAFGPGSGLHRHLKNAHITKQKVAKLRAKLKAQCYSGRGKPGASIRKEFQRVDRDASGRVSRAEFQRVALRSVRLTDDEISALMHILDADNDGTVDYYEFEEFILDHKVAHGKMRELPHEPRAFQTKQAKKIARSKAKAAGAPPPAPPAAVGYSAVPQQSNAYLQAKNAAFDHDERYMGPHSAGLTPEHFTSNQEHYALTTEDRRREANYGAHQAGRLHERLVAENRGAFNNDGAAWTGSLRATAKGTDRAAFGYDAQLHEHHNNPHITMQKVKIVRNKLKMKAYGPGRGGQKFKKEFMQMDKDHNGTLSYSEFAHAVRKLVKLSDDEVGCLLRAMDHNQDGAIDLQEFVGFVKNDASMNARISAAKVPSAMPKYQQRKNKKVSASKNNHMNAMMVSM